MSKEDDIKALYTNGWWPNKVETQPWPEAYPTPEWAKALAWNYSLWTPEPGKPLSETLASYCRGFLDVSPDKVFVGSDGRPYLSKYCIAEPRVTEGEDVSGKIYLNHFHRGDEDQELHNHPWDSSLSLILVNGYDEERRIGNKVRPFERRPGDVVHISGDTYHRVDVPMGEAWTLFFTGKYTKSWYFWERVSGALTPWRDFIKAKGLAIGHSTS